MKKSLIMRPHWIGRSTTAIALATALTLGATPVAMADLRTVTGNVDVQAISQIDPARSIDLTLIKTPPNPYDDVPVGDIPGSVIEGVTFTVRKVNNVDLTTEAGWALARGMSVAEAKRRGFSEDHSAVTDAEGKAYFTELSVGLYLVTETPPANPGVNYERSAEFLITLPTGGDDGEHWNYDVTVYTKDKVKPTDPPTTTPTTTTTPTAPTTTTTPTTPVPDKGTTPPPGLAMTGANVAGLLALALAFIAGGALLIRRGRN